MSGADMKRKESFNIELIDIEKLTATEAKAVLKAIHNSDAEADCLTETIYTSKEAEDLFLDLLKKGKAKQFGISKFPKRYVEDKNGTIEAKDGKKYRRMTEDDLAKTKLSDVKKTVEQKEISIDGGKEIKK